MKIKVMIKEPYKAPYEAAIENELAEFQRIVGGHIETVPCPGVPKVKLICNEMGKIMLLNPNLYIMPEIFFGPVIAVGDGGEKFVSLTDKQQHDAWLSLAIRGMHAPETLRRATGYDD